MNKFSFGTFDYNRPITSYKKNLEKGLCKEKGLVVEVVDKKSTVFDQGHDMKLILLIFCLYKSYIPRHKQINYTFGGCLPTRKPSNITKKWFTLFPQLYGKFYVSGKRVGKQ